MLRSIKILLIASIGVWGLIGAFSNFTDWNGTTGAVGAVTSMSAIENGADSWRATANPGVVLAGALFIVTLKIIGGLLCLAGAWRMTAARAGDAAAFERAKTLALAGCGVLIFLLFAGWIVIAETWFELWRADVWRDIALQSAFRYCGMIGVIALFVGLRDDERGR